MLDFKKEQKRRFFEIFEEISNIPHGSGNTKQISDYCVNFAKDNGLNFIQDKFNNVIIKKEATFGYENHDPVILQGHLDMVCEKISSCDIDFEKDGLQLFIDGDFICANGTTLGGDDGIAVAMVLSILEDNTLKHPAIEAVFTTDEETGMYGAEGLDTTNLKAKTLINIDSENEGVFTVSCAGGARAEIILPIETEKNFKNAFKITLDGLLGGHSGVEIDKGRINANILLGQILNSFPFDLSVADINGGLKDNAIPRSSQCIICCDENPKEFIEQQIEKIDFSTDNVVEFTVEKVNCDFCFTKRTTENIIYLLNNVPNGIQKMSVDIKGLAQTSLNLGVLYCQNDTLFASFAVRSSVNKERDELIEKLISFSENIGGRVSTHGFYPAWEYKKESNLRNVMCETFKNIYKKEAVVEAIHAGLECGLFAEKIKGLDAVSIGPDMCDIHTPNEKLSISSSIRVYDFLCAVLENL